MRFLLCFSIPVLILVFPVAVPSAPLLTTTLNHWRYLIAAGWPLRLADHPPQGLDQIHDPFRHVLELYL